MTKTKLLGALTFCGLAALLSCENGDGSTSGSLSDDDCPIGTFKPAGLTECVFPADDQFGNLLGVSDNRCASGQPAYPPVCSSDTGGRAYFSISKTCAPNYRFQPGACQRGAITGSAGTGGVMTGFGTGAAATGFSTGGGGDTGSGTGAAAVGGQESADAGMAPLPF
jgi:hypothetical protein